MKRTIKFLGMAAGTLVAGFYRIRNGKNCFITHANLIADSLNFVFLFFVTDVLNCGSYVPGEPGNCHNQNKKGINSEPPVIVNAERFFYLINVFLNYVKALTIKKGNMEVIFARRNI